MVGLFVYMPFHIFLSQWLSTFTGGLDFWKIGKDVFAWLLLIFGSILVIWAKKTNKLFWVLWGLLLAYTAIHAILFVTTNQPTKTGVLAMVYNTRLMWFVLIGYNLSLLTKNKGELIKQFTKYLLIVSTIVCVVGLLQWILPKDIMTHFGYSLERGVKPAFFIDDKPDLPRVMSTIRDPNSLGAFLILPILLLLNLLIKNWTMVSSRQKLASTPRSSNQNRLNLEQRVQTRLTRFSQFYSTRINSLKTQFLSQGDHADKKMMLSGILLLHLLILFLTFSRSAWLAMIIAGGLHLGLTYKKQIIKYAVAYKYIIIALVLMFGLFTFVMRDQYIVQNVLLHSDENTKLQDSNSLHVTQIEKGLSGIAKQPLGHGPSTAGLVSTRLPTGGLLTENYFVQIGYEVGGLGVAVFLGWLGCLLWLLRKHTIIIVTLIGLIAMNLLLHIWSNEAVAASVFIFIGLLLYDTKSKNPAKSS